MFLALKYTCLLNEHIWANKMFPLKAGIVLHEIQIMEGQNPIFSASSTISKVKLNSFLGLLAGKMEQCKSRPISSLYSWRNWSPIKIKWLGQGHMGRDWTSTWILVFCGNSQGHVYNSAPQHRNFVQSIYSA